MKAGFLLFCLQIFIHKTVDTASVKAPLDIISLQDITSFERKQLQHLNNLNDQREKRSSHGFLSAIGSGIKYISKGSASASSHESHHYGYPPPMPEEHESKSFDFWSLKKAVLNTLLQAAKAIKGAAIVVTGKLIKGSGYLVSAKGKLISTKGESVSELGKKIAASASLSPSAHHTSYSDHSSEEYHTGYAPSGHHDVEIAPSAPSIEYSYPSTYTSKYPSFEGATHRETLRGLPSGILILKKIGQPRQEAQESVIIPNFRPLQERTFSETTSVPITSNSLMNTFSFPNANVQTPRTTIMEKDLRSTPYKLSSNHNNEDASIKPVVETPATNEDELNLYLKDSYQIKSPQDYNTIPNDMPGIYQSEFSDFSTHPGFYINNLATSGNNLPRMKIINSHQIQFPHLDTHFTMLPVSPRSLSYSYPLFFPNKEIKLKPPNLQVLSQYNRVKRMLIET